MPASGHVHEGAIVLANGDELCLVDDDHRVSSSSSHSVPQVSAVSSSGVVVQLHLDNAASSPVWPHGDGVPSCLPMDHDEQLHPCNDTRHRFGS